MTVYERARASAASPARTTLGGVRVDRFYHAVTPTDDRVLDLAESSSALSVRWRRLGVGFYHDGRLGVDVDARASC